MIGDPCFQCFLKSYHHLHSLLQGEDSFPNRNEEDYNLNIFEMVINSNKPLKKLVSRKLFIFQKYNVDVKDIKHPFDMWENHETTFPTIGLTNIENC
jgi:two-component SAPR family response regulator